MLRVGIAGLGYWGPNLARNVAACGLTKLAALCDQDEDRLGRVSSVHPTARRHREAADLFADPEVDAVAIATPVGSHYTLARAALDAGKHVLVEKPLTASAAEAESLRDLAAANGLTLMVDHVFLFSPPVMKLVDLHASGELGDVQFIDSVRINLGLLQHDVNVLWDLAPHDLSIIDRLLGRAPKGVVAAGISHAPNGLASVAHIHLDYGDLLASVHVNWLSPVKIRHFLVGGTRRSVLYDDLNGSEPLKVYDRGVDVSGDPEGRREALVSYRSGDVVSPNVDRSEPLQNMISHFAACAASGEEPVSGPAQGLRVVRILEAADLSLAKGGTYVEVDGA